MIGEIQPVQVHHAMHQLLFSQIELTSHDLKVDEFCSMPLHHHNNRRIND